MLSVLIPALLSVVAVGCSGGKNSGSGSGSGSAGGKSSGAAAVVKIDGSSTVFPATEAIAEEFQKEMKGSVHVTVGISGTGGGFKKFCRGEIDIADASRPILTEEIAIAKQNGIEYIELPICFDALTVVVNPQATWLDSIKVEELKKMWHTDAQGKITTWSQIRPEWPNEKFSLFGAGSDSGTFDYFTEAVCGKAKVSRGDYTPSEDDNVLVQGVEGDKNALGYLPFSYYEANKAKLKVLAIDWEKNTLGPVKPTLEAVTEGKYNPLSRPLFIYVNKKSAVEKPEVKAFVEYYLNNAKKLVAEVDYLPLPEKAYEMGRERFKKLQTGTGFGGVSEVGLPVEEILKREPK
jgi:phosphate transport system substrate-binding protein